MLFVAIAGGFGIAALSTGAAQAVTEGPSCGNLGTKPCPPTGTISGPTVTPNGEQVTVVWNPGSNPPNLAVDPNSASLNITWTPTTTVPTGAPLPPQAQATLSNGNCSSPQANSPVTCVYDWPQSMLVNGYVLNGTYTLNASADDCVIAALGCSAVSSTGDKTATIANPPSAPTNVKAALDPASSTVKVSWTPSPEPDIAGYRVFRNNGSQACQVSTTYPPLASYSCVDTTSGGGSFSYHVVAVRWGVNYQASQEQPGPASTATPSVTVPGPPATTTTLGPSTTLPPLGPIGFTAKPTPKKATTGGGTGGTFRGTPPTIAVPAGGDNPAAGASGDTGFLPQLPYGQATTTIGPSDPAALSAPPIAHKGKTSVGTIAVIGAGLLVAVIALHGLWLRSEVRRGVVLEPLDPDA